jgi:hypothetical protein
MHDSPFDPLEELLAIAKTLVDRVRVEVLA